MLSHHQLAHARPAMPIISHAPNHYRMISTYGWVDVVLLIPAEHQVEYPANVERTMSSWSCAQTTDLAS